MSNKLVTWVIGGRNDTYMGNYRYRLSTSINFLAANLETLNRLHEVEVLFVDWNSDEPLRDTLPLTPQAASITNFVEVSPEIAKSIYPDGNFCGSVAYNAGIRRAQGEFILMTDSDCLVPLPSLDALLKLLSGQAPFPEKLDEVSFYIRRYQIPWEVVQRQPSVEEWRRYTHYHCGGLRKEFPASNSFGGFASIQLLHRKLWNELTAYDENLKGWGWCDNDLMFRMSQRTPWVDLINYGIFGLHMEHWRRNKRRQNEHAAINPLVVHQKYAVNDPSWGLHNYELPIHPAVAHPADHTLEPLPLQGRFFHKELVQADLASPETSEFLSKILYTELPVTPTEILAALSMATFCLHEYPRNFLHIGMPTYLNVAAVIAAAPGIEMYFMTPWPNGNWETAPLNPPMLSELLEKFYYSGYARLLTFSPEHSMAQLDTILKDHAFMELIYVSRKILGTSFESIITNLLPRIAPGGIMILFDRSSADEAFCSQWTSSKNGEYSVMTFGEDFTLIARAPTVAKEKDMVATVSSSQPVQT